MTQLAPGSPQRTSRGSDHSAYHHDLHPIGHHVGGPDQRRGRHATSLGQGFEWMVGWSILGTLLPGSGLMAAGRRQLGLAVLGVSLCLVSGLAVLSILTDPIALALGFAVSGNKLLILAGVVVLAALLLVTVVLSTHFSLRQVARLTRTQQLFSTALVVGLVAMVLVPAAKVTSYTLIQRDLVSSVFANGVRDKNAARPNTAKADPWADIPRVNVLLLGSDAGADRTGVRTDTMIVASINTKTGDTVLLSLPRNLEHAPFAEGSPGAEAWPDGYYCDRPTDPCFLNSVWVWAEGDGAQYYPKDKYPEPGLAATEDAIHGVTGLKIDYYAMLNLQGFSSFVNALGGITVNVPERLPIGGNSSNHRASGWIEPGKNRHLDGYQALWFARSRWSTTDYDRMLRQRCVIGAIAQEANPANLAKAFPQLAQAAKNNISTSIQQSDLQAWVELTMRIKKHGGIRSLPFTTKVVGSTSNPDYDQINQLVQNALADPATSSASTPSSSASPSSTKTPDLSTAAGRADTVTDTAQNITDVC